MAFRTAFFYLQANVEQPKKLRKIMHPTGLYDLQDLVSTSKSVI